MNERELVIADSTPKGVSLVDLKLLLRRLPSDILKAHLDYFNKLNT